jgi:hypothetical protein
MGKYEEVSTGFSCQGKILVGREYWLLLPEDLGEIIVG